MTTLNLEELKRLAEAAAWTGEWYDAGCNTVHCDYNGKPPEQHDEVAHPVPLGVSAYIAAANPQTILELLSKIEKLERELEEARRDAERYRWLRDMDMLDSPSSDLANAFSIYTGSALDSAIDAIRQGELNGSFRNRCCNARHSSNLHAGRSSYWPHQVAS